MNATDDGVEPLGEHIDTFEAIQRGAVRGILSAADEVLATKQLAERQAQALNKIRRRHVPSESGGWCRECCTTYPCATIRAISEAGA